MRYRNVRFLGGLEVQVLKVGSFGGIVGFYARKLFPSFCSKAYLTILRVNKGFEKQYINSLSNTENVPLVHINLETINRCNGTCPFCPNNVKADKRKLHRMDDITFKKVISDLKNADYHGVLSLQGNGEPFLDEEMPERICYVREELPNAHLVLFTNGTMLNESILEKIAGKLDELFINNYSEKYKLNPKIKMAKKYIESHADMFGGMRVYIEYRYKNEILSNRGGKSPNKKNDVKIYKSRCILPYMETFIFSDGSVGLCCCDVEKTFNFGNVMDNTIFEIFNCDELKSIREKMKNGRSGVPYCGYCDFESKNGRRRKWAKAIVGEKV